MSPLKSSWCALAGVALMIMRKIGQRLNLFLCLHETMENRLPVGLYHLGKSPDVPAQSGPALWLWAELEAR